MSVQQPGMYYLQLDTYRELLRDLYVASVLMIRHPDDSRYTSSYIDCVDKLYSSVAGYGLTHDEALAIFSAKITAEEKRRAKGK